MPKKYYVYLLQSAKDNNYYIGQTDNVFKRVEVHNAGRVGSTKNRLPFKLVGYEEFETREKARWREYNLKENTNERKKFIKKLINSADL